MDRVGAQFLGDDMGYKTGTLISPNHLREYVFPWQKKLVDISHEHGIPFLLHSCGNLRTIMDELIEEVYAIVGPFAYERNDLHINEALKQEVMEKCKNGEFTSFGDLKVERVEDLDGYKFFFENDQWLMIRPSGTEPVLRTYAESDTLENARKKLLSPLAWRVRS